MNLNDVPAMTEGSPSWQLQELSEKHKTAAALFAQGVSRGSVASATGFTPEYLSMLKRQPLFIKYVQEMTQAAAVQLEAMFVQSVEVIGETLQLGSPEEKLKAARLQGELTGRLGREKAAPSDADDNDLQLLANRLTTLLTRKRERIINGEVSNAEIIESSERQGTDQLQGS